MEQTYRYSNGMDKNERLTKLKSIGLGIAIGTGLLLLNFSVVYNYMFNMNNYLYRLNLSQSIGPIVMRLYVLIMIVFLPFSYFYASKYCGKRWKKPSWEWGFWLTLPIIGFTVYYYLDVFINPKYNKVSLSGNFVLIALIIIYFVLFFVSSYGSYVSAKAIRQEEEK